MIMPPPPPPPMSDRLTVLIGSMSARRARPTGGRLIQWAAAAKCVRADVRLAGPPSGDEDGGDDRRGGGQRRTSKAHVRPRCATDNVGRTWGHAHGWDGRDVRTWPAGTRRGHSAAAETAGRAQRQVILRSVGEALFVGRRGWLPPPARH